MWQVPLHLLLFSRSLSGGCDHAPITGRQQMEPDVFAN
jgi:hypothetical protein